MVWMQNPLQAYHKHWNKSVELEIAASKGTLLSRESGKRRRSWRTQKYLLSNPIFSQQIIAGINKSSSEANCILKMGNIWRSFWYTGIIIILPSAGCSTVHTKETPTQGACYLTQDTEFLPKLRRLLLWFIQSRDQKGEHFWRPKDMVNSHDRESLKTALPYNWLSTYLFLQLCHFHERFCSEMTYSVEKI